MGEQRLKTIEEKNKMKVHKRRRKMEEKEDTWLESIKGEYKIKACDGRKKKDKSGTMKRRENFWYAMEESGERRLQTT